MMMRIAPLHVLQAPYELNDGDRRSERTSYDRLNILRGPETNNQFVGGNIFSKKYAEFEKLFG
jgi:hypothetical protein